MYNGNGGHFSGSKILDRSQNNLHRSVQQTLQCEPHRVSFRELVRRHLQVIQNLPRLTAAVFRYNRQRPLDIVEDLAQNRTASCEKTHPNRNSGYGHHLEKPLEDQLQLILLVVAPVGKCRWIKPKKVDRNLEKQPHLENVLRGIIPAVTQEA